MNAYVLLIYLYQLDSYLVEVRTLEQHIAITNYLSTLTLKSLWWIGATDASPKAPKEGKFVWMTDSLEINATFDKNVTKSHKISTKNLTDTFFTVWGPGQPDNWPNQVNPRYISIAIRIGINANQLMDVLNVN